MSLESDIKIQAAADWPSGGPVRLTNATPQIYSAINQVMADIGAVGKDQKNEAQGYKFRGIDQMYNALHPALVSHGVFCVPRVLTSETTERVSKSGTPSLRVFLEVEHRFYAPDGSFVEVVMVGEGIDTSDKATNKALSAAYKYALMELFCIPTADLIDADSDSPEAGAIKIDVPKVRVRKEFTQPAKTAAPNNVYASLPMQQAFAMDFKRALSESVRKKAEELRHKWLGENGYTDTEGKPTSAMIPSERFGEVRTTACAWAREQR